jgi:hypothetical protein
MASWYIALQCALLRQVGCLESDRLMGWPTGSLQTKLSRDALSADKVVANIMQTFFIER